MHKLLFVDTETGGMDPLEHSLLTVGLVVWESKEIVDSKEILVNDGKLIATKEALDINKIDLIRHRSEALPAEDAISELLAFLGKHFDVTNEGITLAGHNICFDVGFLKQFFRTQDTDFHTYFSHRHIDTSSILQYLFLTGIFEKNISSSSDAFSHFNIIVKGRHTALGDALATAELFNHLLRIVA